MGREEAAGQERVDPSEWTLRNEAAHEYVDAATAEVASLVRSTLGPRGMEKLVETCDLKKEPEVVRTKDGDEVLAAIERGEGFNHPAAALFVDVVDSMQRALHDGTTTAVLLAHEFVSRGVDLVERGVHPTTVVLGYSMAADRAGRVLDGMARPVGVKDDDLLEAVAATTFPESLSADRRRRYTRMAVRAVRGLDEAEDGWIDTENAKVLGRPGGESSVHRGVVVRRRPQGGQKLEDGAAFDWTPVVNEPVEDLTVAILDRDVDLAESAASFQREENVASGPAVGSPAGLRTYREGRRARETEMAAGLREMGVDVVVCQDRLDGDVRDVLAAAGLLVVDQVNTPETDVERLSRATGAAVVSRPDDLAPERLGTVGRLSEFEADGEKWAVFDDCDGPAYTLVVGGATGVGTARNERLVRDAVEVVAMAVLDGQVLPGAGAPALAVAADLRENARSIDSREQLAVEAFADALEELVHVLAANAGAGRAAVADLRAARADGPPSLGLGLDGAPVDAWEAGVVEPRRVFSQCIETARAATDQLLTVDAVIYPNVDLDEFVPATEHD